MIAYRNYYESVLTDVCINRIEELVQKIPGSSDMYSDAISLLIETGELETGLSDILCKEQDKILPEITFCRNISLCSGLIVCNLWIHNVLSMDRLYRIHTFLSALKQRNLPLYIELGVPEGFVFYGLYPETFLDAAENFYNEKRPDSVIVIGLRSIGTQLSTIVASRLELFGCKVATCTVRPRGEPFNR
ncbi:MAG: hypothetical protein GX640_18295, partial [Fibrobacter sp.]|nr:hypothetical protein [Fibrobacter sp.]